MDEVVTCHPLLHQRVLEVIVMFKMTIVSKVFIVFTQIHYSFQLFIKLFEKEHESMEVLAQLEIKKMLLDRLVNLLSRGYVIPVVKYIKACWDQTDTDISLIR